MVVEGARLVLEALDAGVPVRTGFYTAEFAADVEGRALVDRLARRGISRWRVTPEVMAAMSDTATPQGILLVLPPPALPPRQPAGWVLILDQLRDPGNLGTIMRAAWAAGVAQLLLPPGTVDLTNPKVVRAGMGAHFYVPARRAPWEAVREIVAGYRVWLAEAGRGTPYEAVDWRGDVALIVGGEATGAGAEARALAAGRCVYIPMAPGVDSLNAAMATSILLFEAARQRGVGR